MRRDGRSPKAGERVLTVGGVFDGIGLLAYGLHLAGLEHRWLCEVDPWRRGVLERRFPGIPVYDDVRAVGGDAEPVHVVAGGFPCKGVSTLGGLEGFGHPETVLWREMARAVGELRPAYVIVENVANLLVLHDGAVWGEVLGDLAALGFDVEWDCLPAGAVGAPHLRDRVFAIATNTSDAVRRPQLRGVDRGEGESGCEATSGRVRTGVWQPRDGGPPARGDVAPDPGGERRQQVARSTHGDETQDAGRRAHDDHEPVGPRAGIVPTAVEWGGYEPAIRRWGALVGPAPKPLLRGVDARGTRGLERSRLSALGDGVQVQIGQILGAYILEREEHMTSAASGDPVARETTPPTPASEQTEVKP